MIWSSMVSVLLRVWNPKISPDVIRIGPRGKYPLRGQGSAVDQLTLEYQSTAADLLRKPKPVLLSKLLLCPGSKASGISSSTCTQGKGRSLRFDSCISRVTLSPGNTLLFCRRRRHLTPERQNRLHSLVKAPVARAIPSAVAIMVCPFQAAMSNPARITSSPAVDSKKLIELSG